MPKGSSLGAASFVFYTSTIYQCQIVSFYTDDTVICVSSRTALTPLKTDWRVIIIKYINTSAEWKIKINMGKTNVGYNK